MVDGGRGRGEGEGVVWSRHGPALLNFSQITMSITGYQGAQGTWMSLSCSSVSGSERADVGETRPRNLPFLLLGIPSGQLYAGRVLQLKPPFLLLCLRFSMAKKENGLPHPDPALGFGSSSDPSVLGKLSPPPPKALWPEAWVCRDCRPDPGPIPASSQRPRSPSPLLWHFPRCGGGAA